MAGQESQECCIFISDVGIRGIYFSLTLGTAKFEQLDSSCSLSYKFLREPVFECNMCNTSKTVFCDISAQIFSVRDELTKYAILGVPV